MADCFVFLTSEDPFGSASEQTGAFYPEESLFILEGWVLFLGKAEIFLSLITMSSDIPLY